jgi:hypothetical protein
MWQDMHHAEVISRCPYGKIGDRLWVREAWAVGNIYDNLKPSLICRDILDSEDHPRDKAPCGVRYPATQECVGIRVRSSIHMPRWASRITLEITEVRVERLREVNPENAIAEGIERVNCGWKDYSGKAQQWNNPTASFYSLWESINGFGSTNKNPWVWAVSFKRVE